MDLNGLWTAEFSSNTGNVGTGVIVVSGPQLLGGDSSFFYMGGIESYGYNSVRGNLSIVPFAGTSPSVFGGREQADLRFEGAVGDEIIIATIRDPRSGYSVGSVKLRRSVRETH